MPGASAPQTNSLLFLGTSRGHSIQGMQLFAQTAGPVHTFTYEWVSGFVQFPACVKTFIMGPELPSSRLVSEPGAHERLTLLV
jgi:hypothetical protein